MNQTQNPPAVATAAVPTRRHLRERGMATIEYAIGTVLVIVIVGVIIASIQGGWFHTVVQHLVEALGQSIQEAFKLDIPILKKP